MEAAGFEKIKYKVLRQLEEHLPADLTYHNAAHTADVLEQAQQIAKLEEKIGDPNFWNNPEESQKIMQQRKRLGQALHYLL